MLNIKVFKLIFNRAYRLTSFDNDKAIEIYKQLLLVLDKILPGAKDSYYEAKIKLGGASGYSPHTFCTVQNIIDSITSIKMNKSPGIDGLRYS